MARWSMRCPRSWTIGRSEESGSTSSSGRELPRPHGNGRLICLAVRSSWWSISRRLEKVGEFSCLSSPVKSPLTPLQESRRDLEATGRLREDLRGTPGESLRPRTLPAGMEAGLPLPEACRGARSASKDELEPERRVPWSTRASLVYIRIWVACA